MNRGGALALRRPHVPATPRFGSATSMQTSSGGICAFFALESFERRSGVATYSLRVINRTGSALICRTWVITRSGDAVLACPVLFEVRARSTASTQVPVAARNFRSFERAVAEVAGKDVHCLVEAPAPALSKPLRLYTLIAAACSLAGLAAFVAAAAISSAMPRIVGFAVPPEALSGTTIAAGYSAAGNGRLSYSITAPDGRRVQGGALASKAGTIQLALPAANQAGAYTLSMAMDGPLGSAGAIRVLNALPSKPRTGAHIEAISVNPIAAGPGQSVSVAYAASADRGYVRIVGTDGTIWAQRPFSRHGETDFVLPLMPRGKELRVLLHVVKGNTVAQSMAGLVVPDAVKPAAANQAVLIAGDDDPNRSAQISGAANGTFDVLTKTVRGGATIRIRIVSPNDGMRVSLMDAQSREVAAVQAGIEGGVVTLPAPSVTIATRYIVEANFRDGFGQESVVEPITVVP